MRKLMYLTLLLGTLVALNSEIFAQSWKDIKPLRSTRADVENVLGSCPGKETRMCDYTYSNKVVRVLYTVGEPCGDTSRVWNVPSNTVLTVSVRSASGVALLKDSGFDLRSFDKEEDPKLAGIVYYRRIGGGVELETRGQFLLAAHYGPTVDEIQQFSCKRKPTDNSVQGFKVITVKCGYHKQVRELLAQRERQICEAVSPYDDNSADNPFPLEVTFGEVDLNDDGKAEIVAWESSWAGTSGGALWILGHNAMGFQRLFETTMTWSPIIVLESSANEWKDIAYYQTGGGLTSGFKRVGHNGSGYRERSGIEDVAPKGKMLIGAKWQRSTFGPVSR